MIVADLITQMQKAFDHLKNEYAALQIGRASAALVEDILVECYGAQSPLKQSANISCPDAKTVRVEPWDKSLIGDIEKALQESNIGINPQNMGEYILLPIPPMTEDRRRQLAKLVHELAENAHIAVRQARQDALKKVKAQKDNKEISEDEAKSQEKEIQEKVDEMNKQIDTTSKNKETEVMSV